MFEADENPGGAVRSARAPLTGALIDVGSAVHPFALASRFFREWSVADRVDMLVPEISYAHPLDDGIGVAAFRDLARTSAELGVGGAEWGRRLRPVVNDVDASVDIALSPISGAAGNPAGLARLGAAVAGSFVAERLRSVRSAGAGALFAGVAAHAGAPLGGPAAASVGATLAAVAHARGWPLPRGGAGALTDALVADFRAHGGRIHLGRQIRSRSELPASRVLLLATGRGQAARLLQDAAPARWYRRMRVERRGPAVFKVDLVLSQPLPWRYGPARRAATVHVGGSAAGVKCAQKVGQLVAASVVEEACL